MAGSVAGSSELESSLTEMDWLAKLNVGGGLAGLVDPVEEAPDDLQSFPLTSTLDQVALSSSVDRGTSKPPFSYTHLIMSAINSSPQKRMALSDIYKWIGENFPYYRNAVNGWKVSDLQFLIHGVQLELTSSGAAKPWRHPRTNKRSRHGPLFNQL